MELCPGAVFRKWDQAEATWAPRRAAWILNDVQTRPDTLASNEAQKRKDLKFIQTK